MMWKGSTTRARRKRQATRRHPAERHRGSGKRFGKDMIVAHRPDLGGVYITPLDPRISLADRARMMSESVPGSAIRYGRARPEMDTVIFLRIRIAPSFLLM